MNVGAGAGIGVGAPHNTGYERTRRYPSRCSTTTILLYFYTSTLHYSMCNFASLPPLLLSHPSFSPPSSPHVLLSFASVRGRLPPASRL